MNPLLRVGFLFSTKDWYFCLTNNLLPYMKKFLFVALAGFFCYISNASHIAGGEITYKHIGDSTGVNHQYLVTLRLFRDMGGVQFGPTQSLNTTSSCDPGFAQTMNRVVPPAALDAGDGGFIIPAYGVCLPNNITINNYSIHYYKTTVILLPCDHWTLYWSSCCRNGAITTLQNSNSLGHFVSSTLNNLSGPNSSPTGSFADDVRIYCIGSNVVMFPFTEEKDGDSLHFEFTNLLSNPFPGYPISYTPGFSSTIPLTSSTPITIDSKTGVINFSPTQVEIAVIGIKVEEWRFNSALGYYVKVSELHKDLQIVITDNCDTNSNKWSLQTLDSIPSITIQNCGDSTINLTSPLPFQCNTLSPDGSDFVIYKPDGTLLPIISASTLCNGGYADSIAITLYDTLSQNDTLFLVSHIGNDFNTLTNLCGFDLRQNDSIMIIVQNCPNIGINENPISNETFSFYPNPADDLVEFDFVDSEEREIMIFDTSGKVLKSIKTDKTHLSIDLITYNPGIYLLKVKSKSSIQSIKLKIN